MSDISDILEMQKSGLPLRRIKSFTLDHISLIVKKVPIYAATSLELRDECGTDFNAKSADPLQAQRARLAKIKRTSPK